MRGLSIKQPWAWLIAAGLKPIETRSWQTGYRGEVLICASKRPDFAALREFNESGAWGRRSRVGEIVYGQAVAVARLVECRPMVAEDCYAACCQMYPGAFSWVLDEIRPIAAPFAVKGALGLFGLTTEIIDKARTLAE